jgi:hypothetical protein
VIISVINLTKGEISDDDLQRAIRAVNRQIAEDFQPYWGFGARLRLEGRAGHTRTELQLADMRGEAILYVRGPVKVKDTEGYHDRYFSGIPYGVVYLDLSKQLNEDWTVTLSHEALELVGDPEANLVVQGPHPTARRKVFHWFEMCDAVQNERYVIDRIKVSNFVLPLYFTSGNERGGRNDFLGTITKGKTLRSFSTNPGGYIGFFDPLAGKGGDDTTWSREDDKRAEERLATKLRLKVGRGNLRRQRWGA